MTAARGCPELDTIQALLVGRLDEPARAEILAHADGCDLCRALVVALARTAAGIPDSNHQATLTGGPHEDSAGYSPPSLGPEARAIVDRLSGVDSLRAVDDSDYALGPELARGGMGRIVEGFDRRHHRRVAIKLPGTTSGHAVLRFIREARITARLQHPSIVPVYEAARSSQGEPFFAMKLVDGRSLDAAIKAATTLEDRLALVSHVIAATEALAYAHGQNVIHRDLKPANILVGAFGETVVIDWGLAKDLAKSGDESTAGAARPGSSSDGLTVDGTTMGTPAYMAPEQARGEQVDPRADVYALGALLYHVLAGQPPYRGDPKGVLAGPPRPIEAHVPRIPPDLAAIVKKAMAREPGDRYPTAAGMAADLRRFANGQLVQAHTYRIRGLIRRWVARHRGPVATAAVLLVVLAVGAALSVREIVDERDRSDRLARLAQEQRVTAIGQRQAAESLVDFLIANLRTRLLEVGRLDLLSDVGTKVDEYYRAVDPAGGSDAAVLGRWATVYETLAEVERQRKRPDAEAKALETAIGLRRRQLERAPGDAAALRAMATDHHGVALLERRRGRPDGWQKARDSATTVLNQLLALGARDPETRLLQARLELDLAEAYEDRGDFVAAQAAYEKHLDQIRAIAAEAPTDEAVETALGHAWFHLGRAFLNQSRYVESEAAYRESVAVRRRLWERKPDDAGRQRQLAWAQFRHGDALASSGNVSAGMASHQEALATRTILAERDPSNRDLQRDVSMSRSAICRILAEAGQLDEASPHCEASLAIAERLAAAAPQDWILMRDLCFRELAQASLEQQRGRAEVALRHAEAALRLADAALAGDGKNHYWRRDAFTAHVRAGSLDVELGRFDQAARHVDAARGHGRELNPDVAAEMVADVDALAGDLALARRDRRGARDAYAAAVAGYDRAIGAGHVSGGTIADAAEIALKLAPLLPASERASLLARASERMTGATRNGAVSPRQRRIVDQLRSARRD